SGNGNDPSTDSDITGFFGPYSSGLFYLEESSTEEVDGGFFECTNIGDLVWYDTNENDIADPNENGIDGLIVNLHALINGSYEIVQTTVTDHKPGTPSDDGYFNFCAPPGTYFIEVIMPPQGLVQAVANIGNNEEIDSDLTNQHGPGTTNTIYVNGGSDITNIGAGFYPMATAGNRVWHDENENGIQESGEANVENVLVEAFELATGNKVAQSTTNASGIYSIEYLQKQDYYLRFSPPSGYGFTTPNTGGELVDSDVDHTFGYRTTAAYSMEPGQNYINIDAGLKFGVLPVEWLSVSAVNKGDVNVVSWSTALETNTEIFEIERKIEGGSFELIGETSSAGNSTDIQSYDFEDKNIVSGLHYYRIKQIDVDGKYEYSKIVSVEVISTRNVISLSPNPSIGETVLSLDMSSGDAIDITIIDNSGRLVRSINVESNLTGYNSKSITITDLPAGAYVVHITQGSFNEVKRLIVIK
ncbi:MAG: SdrD B-like domain-containing protein, partial [Saprospiraceae bacterium]